MRWRGRGALPSSPGCGEVYRGRSSPHWYDGEAFFDLLQAAGSRSVRELVAELDGCTGAKAGRIAAAFKGRACSSLSRSEANDLLEAAQRQARPVSPSRLGQVGEVEGWPPFHARGEGTFRCGGIGGPRATIPFVVEAWASAERDGLRQLLLGAGQPHADHRHGQPLALAARSHPQRLRPRDHPAGRPGTRGHRSAHQHHHALHADHLRRQGAEPVLVQPGDPRGGRQGGAPRAARRAARAKSKAQPEGGRARPPRGGDRQGKRPWRLPLLAAPGLLRDQADRARGGRCRAAVGQLRDHHRRPRARAGRDRRHVPRSARHALPSASQGQHPARHPAGRALPPPGMDLQQDPVHREGGLLRGAEGGRLAGAARLRAAHLERASRPGRHGICSTCWARPARTSCSSRCTTPMPRAR